MRPKFLESARQCYENGFRLLDEAQSLEFAEPPATRYYLSIIAQEEAAKGFLLYLVSAEALPWTRFILRATRNHTCKQLVGIVLDYISPDTDEFLRRVNASVLEGKRMQLPASVADAMNLLRHEKIGRWKSNNWFWAEEPEYDKSALLVARGGRDEDKHRALYVEIGRSGQVSWLPAKVIKDQANDEYQRGRRFVECVRSLVESGPGGVLDFEHVKGCFEALFSHSNAWVES